MSVWSDCLLGDIANFRNGRPSPERTEGDAFPVFGSNGVIGFSGETNADLGTSIIGRVGSYCGSVYYSDTACWVTDNAIAGEPKEAKADGRFLYYLLKKLDLNRAAQGSGQPLLNQSILNLIELTVPSNVEEQKAIAEILSSLDDKIELNRKQNRTLEAIAQAVFKRWFVEFEFPFDFAQGKPDENGRPYKSSGGAMQPSELGEIPVGWDGCLGDVLELAYGKALKEDRREAGKYPVVGSSGVVGMHNEPLVDRSGIVVGRKGNVGSVIWLDTGFYPIDTTFYVVPRLSVNAWHFLYFLLKQQDFILIGSDSAVPGLNRNHAYQNPVVIPGSDLLNQFEEVCNPLFSKIRKNNGEIKTLSNLRDTLLPKLMSGELRVA